jgi:predicted ATPase
MYTTVVAQTLGAREAPKRCLTEALLEHLESRKVLLVLDTCEHFVETCAALVVRRSEFSWGGIFVRRGLHPAGGGGGVQWREGIESDEVLDLLANLVDKSLVMVAEQDGEARYRLLETVRQYGREKLEESGEELSIWRHHAEFSLELAERVEPLINGKDRGFWLERLDAEHDNFGRR